MLIQPDFERHSPQEPISVEFGYSGKNIDNAYLNQKNKCLDIESKNTINKKQQSSKYFIELNKKKKEFEKT